MISPRQNSLYWRLWGLVKRELLNGRLSWSGDEENKGRHELHVAAIGRDKSHLYLTNRELDLVFATFRAVIDPSNLDSQLDPEKQQRRRLSWGLRKVMRELGVDFPYVCGIVRQMNTNGQLSSSRLDALNVDDLRKVLIALRKHKQRGGGTVREYILRAV